MFLVKGIVQNRFLEVGLYKVLIQRHCIAHSRYQSTHHQFGEAERSTDTEAQQCTVVYGHSGEAHLKCAHISLNVHYLDVRQPFCLAMHFLVAVLWFTRYIIIMSNYKSSSSLG